MIALSDIFVLLHDPGPSLQTPPQVTGAERDLALRFFRDDRGPIDWYSFWIETPDGIREITNADEVDWSGLPKANPDVALFKRKS